MTYHIIDDTKPYQEFSLVINNYYRNLKMYHSFNRCYEFKILNTTSYSLEVGFSNELATRSFVAFYGSRGNPSFLRHIGGDTIKSLTTKPSIGESVMVCLNSSYYQFHVIIQNIIQTFSFKKLSNSDIFPEFIIISTP